VNDGDLILYKSSDRWYERLIALATRGPYVHVSIVLGTDFVIAADAQGIRCDVAPPLDNLHTLIPMAGRATRSGIDRGMMWATSQVDKEYGWLDIVYQAVKFLWPHQPFRFSEAGHMDCSDFATRYLLQAGVALPPAFDDPATVTPNDIARWAGVLSKKEAA
jgi:hypothetical protein